MKSKLENVVIHPGKSIREAIAQLNENALRILLVVDESGKVKGTVTDGDIRRGIIREIPLTRPISSVMRIDFHSLHIAMRNRALSLLREHHIPAIPLLDDQGIVQDIVFAEEHPDRRVFAQKDIRVFILAGGRGTRLSPFTNILPKPLIPINEIPIIEQVMRRWQRFGFNNFVLSLNYKGDMIRAFFAENPAGFSLEFVQEKEYLGTAGSLYMMQGVIKETLMVSNCDTLLDIDYDEFLAFHKKSGCDATIVGVIRHVVIPYGVMEMQSGTLTGMREKPEFEFIVNAGTYAIEPTILQRLPCNERIDMPTLLEDCRGSGLRIGVFPVSGEMIDVGHWDEYEKANARIQKFNLP